DALQICTDRVKQVLGAIERHAGQAGIVYCIRRSEVDEVSAALVRRGVRALPYHAGLDDTERRRNPDAFVNERRAGRDGLQAECLLLWSGADYGLWKSVLERDGVPPPGALRKLGEMFAFC